MKRWIKDVLVVLSMAALPLVVCAGFEQQRMWILAAVYGVVALVGGRRLISSKARQMLDLTVAAILLSLAWLQSFAAWSHSTPIGLYLLFGTAVLVLALTSRTEPERRDVERARRDPEAERIREAHLAMLAVWNLSR